MLKRKRLLLARHRLRRGFTLIEMLVTMVVMALLVGLAVPSMGTWIRNSRLRAASDSLQDGLRLAQAESLRRSRQTVFSLTDNAPTTGAYTATANGKNWAVSTVPAMVANEKAQLVESGLLSELGSALQISGPAAICFNSLGRLVANNDPGVIGAGCTLPSAMAMRTYDIAYANAVTGDRPLRVTVALGGQVRLCDPAKTLSPADPDGCFRP